MDLREPRWSPLGVEINTGITARIHRNLETRTS
jgi:hypothetical protein